VIAVIIDNFIESAQSEGLLKVGSCMVCQAPPPPMQHITVLLRQLRCIA
jgi:hypothetical protein